MESQYNENNTIVSPALLCENRIYLRIGPPQKTGVGVGAWLCALKNTAFAVQETGFRSKVFEMSQQTSKAHALGAVLSA